MRLPVDNAVGSPCSKFIGNKENVEPEVIGSSSESSAAANLLWLLDFRLDNLLPNDGNNCADKMTNNQVNKEQNVVVAATSSNGTSSSSSSSCSPAVKPPYTYTELIEQALSEKGPLTVAEIYRWISERFPYFKANDDRWKNSVRHNLSISPHFRKSVKARTGTGHLWTLALPPSARTIAANLAQKAKENKCCDEEMQDEAARACIELLRAEGHTTSSALQTTEFDCPVDTSMTILQNGRDSPLTFEKAAELMLADNNCGEGRVQVEFLARPLQLLAMDSSAAVAAAASAAAAAVGGILPEFLNPIPRDELMEESGLFSLQDPFAQMGTHQNNHCQIQVINSENQMQSEDVTSFDPFCQSVSDATTMLFGDDYPLSYSYEIL